MSITRRLISCLLVASLASSVCFAETPPGTQEDPAADRLPPLGERWRNGWRNVGQDAKYLIAFPARPTKKGVAATIGVLAGIGVLMYYDQEIRDWAFDSRGETSGQIEDYLEPMGRILWELGVVGLVYVGGKARKDEKATETARTLFEALSMNEVATYAAKYTFGRTQPSRLPTAGRFFSGQERFPSGHASRVFTIAAVLSERHGPVAAWIAYPLAALVSLSRIESDNHWASDVLAGSALGWGIGNAIARRRAERAGKLASAAARRTQVDVTPMFAPATRSVGVHFHVRF